MIWPWWLTVLLLFSVSRWSTAAEIPATTFDLGSAIRYAVENSPDFDSNRGEYQISLLEEKTAFSRFLPSLDLTATHGILDEAPRTSTGPSYSELSLSLTENLYDNGVTLTQYEISQLKSKMSKSIFESKKNKISLEIVTAYIQYSLYTKLLEIEQAQYNLIKKQFAMIASDYHQGIKTRKDYLRFKTQISRGDIDLINVKTLIDRTRQKLQNLIGFQSEKGTARFTPLSLNDAHDTNSKATLKVTEHPQYSIFQLQKKINSLEMDLITRKTGPEITLSAGASYGSSNYLNSGSSFSDNDKTSWNALLTFKYNILDWGIRSRNRDVAIYRSRIQDNEVDSKILSLQTEIDQVMLQLWQMGENFKLSKELLALEQTNLQFIEQEYRNGKVQYLDLVTGLKDLADAQTKFYTSLSEFRIAQYTYMYHQGSLYDYVSK